MRRIILALLALFALTISAPAEKPAQLAWFADGGELQGFQVGGAVTPTLTFLRCVEDTTNAATWTFTSENTGTASASRSTIVGVYVRDNATIHDTTAVTVGGDSATQVVDEEGTASSTTSLWILANPSGTAENIVVTHSEAALNVVICVWAAYDLTSTTAVASTADDEPSPGTNALVLNLSATSADGIAVGICGLNDNGGTATWTGLAEQGAEVGADGVASAAHLVPTNGSSLAVTCNWTGSVSETGVSASFR